jgi:hypothetical protein
MRVKKLVLAMFAIGVVGGTAMAADQRGDIHMLRERLMQGQPQMMYSKSGDNWFAQHVTVNGQLNVDLGVSDKTRFNPISGVLLPGNSAFGPTGLFLGTGLNRGSSDITLYNSNVSVDVQPINWVTGHIELSGQESNNVFVGTVGIAGTRVPFISLDEAYAMLGDLAVSPFYMTAGWRYMPFGYYNDPHVLTPSLTQYLTQVQNTSIQVGYAQPCGFHAAGYVFRGLLQNPQISALGVVVDNRANINNGGIDLGYVWGDGQGMKGFDAGIGWLYNMSDVLAVQSRYNATLVTGWTTSVGGLAARLGGYYNQFDASVDYVTALRRFNAADITGNIQPSAIAGQVGFGFRYMGHEHHLSVGYQQSFSASNAVAGTLGIPERRWEADWTVGLATSTKLQFQYTNDRDYGATRGGTGTVANTGQVRLSVGFL